MSTWKVSWDNDTGPDDPENPKHVPPDDPNQLCLPFIFDEIGIEHKKPIHLQTA